MVEKVVATPDIRPAFVEQYRKLAGILHHAQLERNIKVVLVTSAVAGEGKSLTATNLALTFSESYHRTVLLVDADLRRPTLHETFQVPNVVGPERRTPRRQGGEAVARAGVAAADAADRRPARSRSDEQPDVGAHGAA